MKPSCIFSRPWKSQAAGLNRLSLLSNMQLLRESAAHLLGTSGLRALQTAGKPAPHRHVHKDAQRNSTAHSHGRTSPNMSEGCPRPDDGPKLALVHCGFATAADGNSGCGIRQRTKKTIEFERETAAAPQSHPHGFVAMSAPAFICSSTVDPSIAMLTKLTAVPTLGG